MRKLLLTMLLLPVMAAAQINLTPVTTLTAETANNTSAANTFAGEPNGDLAAGNVSKMPIRSLLYAGATTKIYAHLMPWFGTSSHINVGYDSSDPAQAARQVADMASRGIDGVIVDWYGPTSTHHNIATQNVLASASKTSNFEFAICEDYGSVRSATDPTQKTISDLNYAWQTFMQSPAYMQRNGRPVIFFFGFEGQAVDLTVVKVALTFNPIFIMRNSGGFTEAASDGSYSWLAPLTSGYDNYMSLPYLDNFYATALQNGYELAFGSGFKGFNDTLASWAPPGGRHIEQYCGQTWLDAMTETARYYSAANQLPALQIVTWNDYEEGTSIESGIDNCVSITAWMAGDTLAWSITGQENTVDHYTVYASTDGTNLAKVGDFPIGSASLDLSSLGLTAGSYQFFVKAVGKASLANHMSAAVPYSVAAVATPATTDYALNLAPASVTVARGGSAQLTLAVKPTSGSFASSVALSCTGLPAYMGCSFASANLTPGSAGASTTITITAAASNVAAVRPSVGWQMVPAFGMLAFFGAGWKKRRPLFALVALAALTLACSGCGAGTKAGSAGIKSQTLSPGTYTITIAAASGPIQHSTTASVVVQ